MSLLFTAIHVAAMMIGYAVVFIVIFLVLRTLWTRIIAGTWIARALGATATLVAGVVTIGMGAIMAYAVFAALVSTFTTWPTSVAGWIGRVTLALFLLAAAGGSVKAFLDDRRPAHWPTR